MLASRIYLHRISKTFSKDFCHSFRQISLKTIRQNESSIWIKDNNTQKRIGTQITLIKSDPLNSCYSRLHEQTGLLCTRQADTVLLRCRFHTTGQRSVLPPVIWAVLAPIYKLTAVLAGRNLRNKLRELPPHLRKKYYRWMAAAFAAALSILGGFALYFYESHLQEAPISGRRRFITLDKEQCRKTAEYELESLIETYEDKTLPATHPYYQIVVNIGQRLVNANKDIPGMTDHQWVVHVVESPERNAFVLPNGHIFVFTGMIEFCENQDQLAVILGHEMAHAVLLHAAEQLSYSQFSDKIIIVLMTGLWTFLPNDGIAVVFHWYCNKLKQLHLDMPYSRALEKEADFVGLQLATKACFDIREGAVLWGRMAVFDDLAGKERVPEWLSTHPTHANRVKNLNELIPKNLELREKCSCSRLPELDPRIGVQTMKNLADNILIAKASKANLQRVEEVRDKLHLPTVVESVKLRPTTRQFSSSDK